MGSGRYLGVLSKSHLGFVIQKHRRCSSYHFIPEHLQRMEGMKKDWGLWQ